VLADRRVEFGDATAGLPERAAQFLEGGAIGFFEFGQCLERFRPEGRSGVGFRPLDEILQGVADLFGAAHGIVDAIGAVVIGHGAPPPSAAGR
jgi:hypothetical protein